MQDAGREGRLLRTVQENRCFGEALEDATGMRKASMSESKVVMIYTRGIAAPGGGAYGALLVCDGRRKDLSGGDE